MDIQIINSPLTFTIYGFGGFASNKDYAGTAFKLSGKMWEVVKRDNVKNKGKNVWVYETNDKVFAGVELETENWSGELERKLIVLPRYAYYKHVGPYSLIKQAGQRMRDEMAKQGLEVELPYIEIYGHWTKDESKLETDLLMCLK